MTIAMTKITKNSMSPRNKRLPGRRASMRNRVLACATHSRARARASFKDASMGICTFYHHPRYRLRSMCLYLLQGTLLHIVAVPQCVEPDETRWRTAQFLEASER